MRVSQLKLHVVEVPLEHAGKLGLSIPRRGTSPSIDLITLL
jgi:hypothetical protein